MSWNLLHIKLNNFVPVLKTRILAGTFADKVKIVVFFLWRVFWCHQQDLVYFSQFWENARGFQDLKLFFSRGDMTQTGHILGRAERRAELSPERGLTPACCAVLRLLLHLAMFAGTATNSQVCFKVKTEDSVEITAVSMKSVTLSLITSWWVVGMQLTCVNKT